MNNSGIAQKHYQVWRPTPSHFRRASCEEVNCEFYLQGWITGIDESTPEGQTRATWIRTHRKGEFTEGRTDEGLSAFIFQPGKQCFNMAQHLVPLEKEPFWIVKSPGMRKVHANGYDWVEDFAEHQEKLSQAQR